jgi:tyrosine-protein kinase Etk/Wzc
LILSLFVGGFIGVLIALIRNMMRSGIKDSTQIENELDLPVYATVPRSPVQESRINILKRKRIFLFWLLKIVMILLLKA